MDDDKIFDEVREVDLKKTMENSYIDYAMSVIAARALPDVRDGLKPVQRRILYSMIELNNGPDKPHRKCARIVGDTMGKYHPHGDSSIYDALVKLAQEWNTRYPLVDGHGNFGSVDGDGAAAMRYTEARLTKISMEMLADINKDTVDFIPNFDETEKEPTVLPSRYPNLLVNGTTGIAVGMATNIPPHNLREITSAAVKMINNRIDEERETDIEEILEIVKGPDFPTGAQILGVRGINEAYRTGRGKIKVRAVSEIEPMQNGKHRIVITELPYMVNKAMLIKKIADLVKDKRVDGITDLRDESSREGMRVVIEVRRDANPNIILNNLYKHTQLEDTFGVNMLALVNNEPKVLSLPDMLKYYIKHQEEVVTRRTQFDLNKAEERAHIVEGLLIAIDNIDEVIRIIRAAANVAEAKANLIERFSLSEAQAQAIVDMRLRALTGLEKEKLEAEYKELLAKISYLKSILADEKILLGVIRDEMQLIADKYGDDRRTSIGEDEDELVDEDLIPEENAVLTMTHLGYFKRTSVDNFHAQNRGGRGIKGVQTLEEDFIEDILMTTTKHYILCFTNKGRVYKMKVYQIPEAGRNARGTAIVNLLQLDPEEHVTAVIPLKEFSENKYLIMVTKHGIIKKTPQTEYANIRKNGIIAMTLQEDDELIEVKTTDNTREIFMVTKYGVCIRFKDTDIRSTGRSAMGVRGMNLSVGDEVVGMQLSTQGEALLIVSENGLGKRTLRKEFPLQKRGGKGVKCYKITDKTGDVVGVKAVNPDHEVMLITNEGIIIQIKCDEVSMTGRNTSGVKLMKIDADSNVSVAGIAKVREEIRIPGVNGEEPDETINESNNENDSEITEEVVDTEVTEEEKSDETDDKE
ncbi:MULTISPECIES: DNA gyrase subunit A [Eubacterium]|uniref:DNA gyrase subunit A n=1 Tax=Eubacterium ruminantium TaxID=42322 RepID=A0A1T4N337_9FIRM|nr:MULTISPECIES: DNA gyrase subunit A [Eubacterium]MCR5367263.1 DNA gyrase subunit A [Eubacterium sp.]SCW51650.1 DNA gyrase subunit A [Eubacterium ruminantium]SDM66759.1 DNA gyrase subunit A [Eubacterium ruminantium]SJZ73544.1 DNA gyrase subunit A [Eubacterium ruminantium]